MLRLWLPGVARLARAGLALLFLAGLAIAGNGLYIKAKAAMAQVLLDRAFAARLGGDADAKPWPWADFTLAGRIEVSRIGRGDVVIEGASGQAMAFGPGHLQNTPMPGDEGTAVIAAHRDTHFTWLRDVAIGDRIGWTRPDGITLNFIVTGTRIAAWNESGINAGAFGRHLALITCWPFESKFHGNLRYIVEAELRS